MAEQLDAKKPLDIQRGVQISSLRRRLETKLVAKPLEVSLAQLEKYGYPRLRADLTKQFVALTQEERLLWLNNFLFILTPDLRKLTDKIANIRAYRSLGQQRNFLLGGKSGMGKTTFLNWLTVNNLPRVEQQRNIIPVIKVDAPRNQKSSKTLFQRIILECGHTYLKSSHDEDLLHLLILLFQQCHVELLVVDEIEHLVKDEYRRRLLEVSNLSHGVPIICASCNPLNWTAGDQEVQGRWNDYFELHQVTGPRLAALLSYLELLLPFSGNSHLPEFKLNTKSDSMDGPAALIQQWTGGILRDIMILLTEASIKAIKANANSLSPELLKLTWDELQTKRVIDFLPNAPHHTETKDS